MGKKDINRRGKSESQSTLMTVAIKKVDKEVRDRATKKVRVMGFPSLVNYLRHHLYELAGPAESNGEA